LGKQEQAAIEITSSHEDATVSDVAYHGQLLTTPSPDVVKERGRKKVNKMLFNIARNERKIQKRTIKRLKSSSVSRIG
jgi:hypothetical protein